MVKYISAKSASLNDIFKEISPDFNSKLSSILKQASQPTWDLKEIKNKKPEEFGIQYIIVPDKNNPEDLTKATDTPVRSTVKMFYKGTTDTDKVFYIDITKTMCVRGFEDLENMVASGELTFDHTENKSNYFNIAPEYVEDIKDFVRDWDDWIDSPEKNAIVDLQYNKSKSDIIKQSYEVPVDKIDEAIQEFVDKYIDV